MIPVQPRHRGMRAPAACPLTRWEEELLLDADVAQEPGAELLVRGEIDLARRRYGGAQQRVEPLVIVGEASANRTGIFYVASCRVESAPDHNEEHFRSLSRVDGVRNVGGHDVDLEGLVRCCNRCSWIDFSRFETGVELTLALAMDANESLEEIHVGKISSLGALGPHRQCLGKGGADLTFVVLLDPHQDRRDFALRQGRLSGGDHRPIGRLPFPVYENYEECSTARGLWRHRGTPGPPVGIHRMAQPGSGWFYQYVELTPPPLKMGHQ